MRVEVVIGGFSTYSKNSHEGIKIAEELIETTGINTALVIVYGEYEYFNHRLSRETDIMVVRKIGNEVYKIGMLNIDSD